MQIFDTHSHYNLEPIYFGDASWRPQWQAAQDAGVVGSIVIGTHFANSAVATQIAAQDTRLGAAIGIHPGEYCQILDGIIKPTTNLKDALEEALRDVENDIDELRLILNDPNVVAIGETGLDYFHFGATTDAVREMIIKVQKAALREHLKLADGKIPVILHVRDTTEQAYWDIIEILKQTNYTGRFILHCVSGPLSYVDTAVEMGAYISIAGNVTYKSAEQLREIVRRVPKDRLLVETDAPFLPPVPYRGQSCEPWMISKTAEYLVTELEIDPDQLVLNSYRLFPTLQTPR